MSYFGQQGGKCSRGSRQQCRIAIGGETVIGCESHFYHAACLALLVAEDTSVEIDLAFPRPLRRTAADALSSLSRSSRKSSTSFRQNILAQLRAGLPSGCKYFFFTSGAMSWS